MAHLPTYNYEYLITCPGQIKNKNKNRKKDSNSEMGEFETQQK